MAKEKLDNVKQCWEDIRFVLEKYGCEITAKPIFSIKDDGNLQVTSNIKIVSVNKPKKNKYDSKYVN